MGKGEDLFRRLWGEDEGDSKEEQMRKAEEGLDDVALFMPILMKMLKMFHEAALDGGFTEEQADSLTAAYLMAILNKQG